MKSCKEIIRISLIVLVILILSNLFNFRSCLIYNIFHIPCPCCGTTRAFIALLQGKLKKSLEYTIMHIILIILFGIIIIWKIADLFYKSNSFEEFVEKNRKMLICIFSFITILVWILNLRNPLLY